MGPIISSNQRHKSHHPLHEAGSSRIRLQRDHRPQSAQCGAKRRARAEASIEPRGTTAWRIHPSDLGPFILFII